MAFNENSKESSKKMSVWKWKMMIHRVIYFLSIAFQSNHVNAA